MKKIIFICIILMITIHQNQAGDFSVYEANYPGVKDYNVNVDEATLVVHPRGNFIEMNLYLTISYDFNSWFFKNYKELEFQWEFSLPEQAIMHDFWVWFGDSIMRAEILDKWTAELLFSDVSSPVRNPGLLTQSAANRDGQVAYRLRLFPIVRNEKKRFMIQYLLPARPTVESLRAWLPTTQLVSQKSPGIDSLRIIYRYDDNPAEPKIVGTTVLSSRQLQLANAWLIIIPLEFDQYVELVLPSPIRDKFYFSTFEQNGQKYYHFATYPPVVPKQQVPRRVLIVIDFNRYNTRDLDGEFLLSYLKETLQQAFNEADSINLMVAYDFPVVGDAHWVSCSEANIDRLFETIMKRTFPSYSNFQPLIEQAASFINRRPGTAEMLVITNTDEISLNESQRDIFADEIIAKFKAGTKIHFIDLENKSSLMYNYNTGYYETQLESFYGKICQATAGNLYFLRFHSLKTILGAFFYEEISHFESIEVQLRFQNGYAHSKHLMGLHEGYYPLHFPIMEVGKYDGELPVDVTVLGKIRMTQVIDHFTINPTDVTPGTAQIVASWYGDHIRSLLRSSSVANFATVNDIIKLSIDQRILTPYTGFLIFYPDEEHGYCQDCIDETKLTEVEVNDVVPDSSFELVAFPNPFNSRVTLYVHAKEIAAASDLTLAVYNIRGQQVYSQRIAEPQSAAITWRAENEQGQPLPSGVYFAVLKGPQMRKVVKLMLIR
ncbi:MAG: T9SS type A sorting domain-containing protein [candidate division KSB1 bacterium]|nr:T9SS type A sorting domain-containing protein [candidate division KSB1 bacterium]